jgi:hypothetical protein
VRRFAAFAALFAIVLGAAPGQGKSRRVRALPKKECVRICARIMECAGMPRQNSTVVETLICADDCVVESKDDERRPGWVCASGADTCEALKACNAGGKAGGGGRPEPR